MARLTIKKRETACAISFKNHSKHDPVAETDGNGNVVSAKCDVCLKGFSYLAFRPTKGWEKISAVGAEDEAKQK